MLQINNLTIKDENISFLPPIRKILQLCIHMQHNPPQKLLITGFETIMKFLNSSITCN